MIRKLSAIALAVGLALTATGCSFSANPETLQSYAPSDGAGLDMDLGGGEVVKLRNFVYLTDGSNGSLYGVAVNSGKVAQHVMFQATNPDGTKTDDAFMLEGGASYSINQNGNAASAIKTALPAGAVLTISVSADMGANWYTLNVPVLDGSIAEFRELVAGLATPTAAPAAEAPTPEATASN